MLRCMKYQHTYKGGSFRDWFVVVLYRCAYDKHRKPIIATVSMWHEDYVDNGLVSVEDVKGYEEWYENLIRKLPIECHELFKMKITRLTYQQIADLSNQSKKDVGNQIRMLRTNIKTVINK